MFKSNNLGDKFALSRVLFTLALVNTLLQIIPALVECEDIRLEQGSANLFGDRLESKYSGFGGQEDIIKSNIYTRPRNNTCTNLFVIRIHVL